MVASDTPPPGGADPGGSGVKVSPEGLTQFANDVQTLWDGVLGPQGTAAPDGVATMTDATSGGASGVFGPLGDSVGVTAAHDAFRQAALQLLGEAATLLAAVPTKVADSSQIYTTADQNSAFSLYDVNPYGV